MLAEWLCPILRQTWVQAAIVRLSQPSSAVITQRGTVIQPEPDRLLY